MTLRARITLAAVATMLLVTGAVIVASALIKHDLSTQSWQAAIASQEVLWGKIVSSQFDHMAANTAALTRNEEALRALQQANAVQLADRALPVYNRLSASNVLTELQITDTHGNVVFAVPQAFTGRTSKRLVHQTLEKGLVTRGIERDERGKLVAQVVFPLYLRGHPIGVGVFARTLQAALEDFQRAQQADAFILGHHGTAEYTTNVSLLPRLPLRLPPLGERAWRVIPLQEHTYAVAVHPLPDAVGTPQAHLVSITDYTRPYRHQRRIAIVAYAVGLVGLLGALVGLSWYMRRAFQPLKASVTVMNTIAASGNGITPLWEEAGGAAVEQPRLPLFTAGRKEDEIGEVVSAFRHMILKRRQVEEDNGRLLDEAQAANRAKSAFLATMSHELRTPLNAIIGYSELLQEEAVDLGQEGLLPDLQKIHTAGKHLLTLVSDVLDLSKIEAGKMDLYLETFVLSHTIQELVCTIGPLLDRNANTLTVHCADDLGSIRTDRTKVQQVLLNLLSNASKFTERGTITLEVARKVRADTEWIVCTVSDTGIGLTPEHMGKLFQPFTQGDSSTTRKYGGTGLGLALSQQLCRLMGGNITVKSIVGQGATFTVQLPAYVTSQPAATPPPAVEALHQPDVVSMGY